MYSGNVGISALEPYNWQNDSKSIFLTSTWKETVLRTNLHRYLRLGMKKWLFAVTTRQLGQGQDRRVQTHFHILVNSLKTLKVEILQYYIYICSAEVFIIDNTCNVISLLEHSCYHNIT